MLKVESNLSETTERAAALLEELRTRLNAEIPRENTDDLDRELQAYFSTPQATPPQASVLNEIRDRVVEGVVDRIMRAWEDPTAHRSSALEEAVVERLIDRVLDRLGKDPTGSGRTGRAPELR